MQTQFLTTNELAARWKLSYKILCEWRCSGHGPLFFKIGGRIRYRVEDVEIFEASKLRQSTSTPSALPPHSLLSMRYPNERQKILSNGRI